MKAVNVTINGQTYPLIFNGSAMFEIDDKFGSSTTMLDEANKPGKEGFEALINATSILIEQGELTRRYYGHEPQEYPDALGLKLGIRPFEIAHLKRAIMTAVIIGFGREVKDNEDIDLDLIEIEQKKTKA